MGQYFMLINLDKGHRMFLGKFGELYMDTDVALYLSDKDPQYSWAGDRLILLGDYARNFPQGILTAYEDKFKPRFGWVTGFPDPRGDRRNIYSQTSVLRNLCTREYIRADVFPGTNGHPSLGDVLMTRVIWTTDSSLSLGAEIDIEGRWAGGRMDIVEHSVVRDDPVWKDITEVEFFDFYEVWACDMDGPAECSCALCEKFLKESRTFFRNHSAKNKSKLNNAPVKKPQKEMVIVEEAAEAGQGEPLSLACDNPSAIETLPTEIQGIIFTNMSPRDVAACAATSKALFSEATRYLYASVHLTSAEQTKALLKTLVEQPKYSRRIKDLRVVTMAHWESLQVAHEILKRLPALESLEFAPCWFSYGDLAYWEYPFELRKLNWGLMDDLACKMFFRHYPNVNLV